MLSVRPLQGRFGVQISGIDLSMPMDDETERESWDTYSTLKATLHDRPTTPGTRRLLWRVSVTGKAPIYGNE